MQPAVHRGIFPLDSRYRGLSGLVLFLLGLLAVSRLWDWEREREHLGALDSPLQQEMSSDQNGVLDGVATGVSAVATPEVVPFVVLIGALVWWAVLYQRGAGRGRKAFLTVGFEPMVLLGSVFVGSVSVTVLKAAVARSRPPAFDMVNGPDASFSFPSGHTCVFATAVLVLAYLVFRNRSRTSRLTAYLVAGAAVALVALSRLYLGYHWLTDTCASVGLAVAVLGLAVMVVSRFRPRR